jgi:hypothetical protein
VSPTDTLIAAVWVETASNVDAGYADIVNLTLGGPVADGTHTTSEAGLILSFTVSRTDASGTDLFYHQFVSMAGECQVTMTRGTDGVSGTFSCTGLTSDTGIAVNATGSYAT